MEFSMAINEEGLLYVPFAEVKQQEEELKQELEVYKKALELMSIHLQRFQDCKCFGSKTWAEYFLNKARFGSEEWLEWFLQKAREEE